MPTIVIDDQEIEVPHGTKVIEAAEQLGIMIPRFCYHPALGSVGACRVCAVKFLQGPFKGVQMSCMIEARDGMVVSTTDEEAVDFRRHVIEWLMLHHPHDCPVCDEGGHCLLQDETVSGGHGIRRYLGKKRTYTDQYLGPLVQHEMNRCIHCYRCPRFYQEFTGYRDLGAMGIGNRTYFGRYRDGMLESPFSGNLIDICPTGVYTDKPARFKGRRWDFERTPSLCIHCSLGCHTTASARYRELMRLEARFSEAVNGYFICDRGRFGFSYVNFSDRPRRAVVAENEVSLADAVMAAGEQLGRLGANAVACVGSARSSLETLALLRALARNQGWRGPVCFTDEAESRKVREALSGLAPELAVSLGEIEQADFILALGVDPLSEAPMLALAMRQASRQGTRIAVLDPRRVELPFPFDHLPLHPDEIEGYAASLVNQAIDGSASGWQPGGELAERLRRSRAPVVLCGTDVVRVTTPAFAADCARMLRTAKERTGLFFVLPGSNACGAAMISPDLASLETLVDAIETGSVRALVVAESDLFSRFPDERRLEAALDKLDLLFVVDYVATRTAARASILLPAETLYEAGGCFVNQEGRLQRALPAYRGGTPIVETGGGDHPPRIFRADIPGGEPRPAWEILAELAEALSGRDLSWRDLWQEVARDVPALGPVPPLDEIPEGGIRLRVAGSPESARSRAASPHAEPSARIDETLELILVEWTFGTEELSSLSPHLEKVEKSPCLLMHADDAARLGFENGDRVLLTLEGGTIEVDLCVKENMAKGIVFLPRHRSLPWRKVKRSPALVAASQIKKI
jgi:NADH-quinone oxidoreductase subunit G